MDLQQRLRSYWNTDAETYDNAPGHRPTSEAAQAAWATAVARVLPPPPARVLDCGAGTGFLSLIAARQGHKVTALDISSAMLDRLRDRAAQEGLGIEVVEGAAEEPPTGPFDAVMERHLIWTLPDPVAALRAWRRVAPMGRLILVEGVWGSADPAETVRGQVRRALQRVRKTRSDHHARYDDDTLAALPFGKGAHPSAVVAAAVAAGWPDPWIERLRDVEWAASMELPLVERMLGMAPRYIVTAG
jgi:ubiquinone/menaquinone biosynthesis C-methylase UbiE